MLKRLSYFFVLISVIITVSHTIVAHHHHFETEAEEAHHHDDGDDDHHDHNMFSFGQLDDSFTFSDSHITVSNDISTALFLIPANPFSLAINIVEGRRDFINHEEFPPPEDYFHFASHRGPPTV